MRPSVTMTAYSIVTDRRTETNGYIVRTLKTWFEFGNIRRSRNVHLSNARVLIQDFAARRLILDATKRTRHVITHSSDSVSVSYYLPILRNND